MFRTLSDTARAVIFIAGVLLISLTTAQIAGGLILAVSPLLMTMFMMFVVTRDGYRKEGWRTIGFTRLGAGWWPITLLVTAGVSFLSFAAVVGVGAAHFTLAPTAGADLLSLCITGPILAFAEEVGWRGYLQSHLARRVGQVWSWIVIGAVWVCWHLPYILLTPDYHTDGSRVIVLLLFTGSVFAFSILFGLLRERSGSVWVAVLAHFGHNAAFAWIGTNLVVASDPVLVNEYLAGDTGLFVLLGTAVSAALLLLWSRRRTGAPAPVAQQSHGEA
ncbi:lysostaphin resistance A-like protein [Microbacterium gorillae]|uniref:CPBP family intramembrane glutamic endopeptidase n=1 Tax=Microbacterium gorillae TaxID=1231063 RepID=UPI003D95FEA1